MLPTSVRRVRVLSHGSRDAILSMQSDPGDDRDAFWKVRSGAAQRDISGVWKRATQLRLAKLFIYVSCVVVSP